MQGGCLCERSLVRLVVCPLCLLVRLLSLSLRHRGRLLRLLPRTSFGGGRSVRALLLGLRLRSSGLVLLLVLLGLLLVLCSFLCVGLRLFVRCRFLRESLLRRCS